MATAAFKSSSRRPTSSASSFSFLKEKETKDHPIPTSPTRKKPTSANKSSPPRRSRSVSAVSRSSAEAASLDFLNKRDNPLYWSSVSPPEKESSDILSAKPKALDSDDRRGRSVSRNANVSKNSLGNKKDAARSLSRVDEGRRRSLSRGPVARTYPFNSESDVEPGGSLLTKYRNINRSDSGWKSNLVGSSCDSLQQIQSSRPRSRRSASNLSSSPTLSLEDGILGSSFSEAKERTSIAICEQTKSFQDCDLGGDASAHIYETVRSEVRRAIADIQNDLENAIRRSNATAIATTNVTDIPPDLVNPGAVELVLDIRSEYENKLEQSQARARKLRADLAVEEHRGLEISRILKEVLPDPKSSNMQKSRPRRKSSIERRKMSKRLTEEAMTYFDECVSLSTFDSSDFSSQEDPPVSLVGTGAPVDCPSFAQASTSIKGDHLRKSWPNDKQEWGSTCSHGTPRPSATISSKECSPDEIITKTSERHWGNRFQFSFSHNQNGTFGFQHDIGKYIKSFEKDSKKVNSINSEILRSNNSDLDEYNLKASAQSLLFDRVFFRNQTEYGKMLLCGGGLTISLSPFASVI
ncbi:hypothetical protein JCGZ_03158 [Jatropha curcas]|uniref:Uncharacterized protein n=1 Tax=Jatropha curcas TaxID=180498 RepID=A0A067KY09_JATCU|nr:uncharacterized protein LOC105631102 [Jatropha curcas]KDP41052.1 hypothetical protein JCGZ_03158 [Jatropha curcas]